MLWTCLKFEFGLGLESSMIGHKVGTEYDR